jgi:hypothetical protein
MLLPVVVLIPRVPVPDISRTVLLPVRLIAVEAIFVVAPLTVKPLLMVVVPDPPPIERVVAAAARETFVAFALKRLAAA